MILFVLTINKPKIYKNPDRTSFIDLILTNCPQSFQNSFFLKNRSEENNINYNKQRYLCVTLLGKSKTEYYQNLSVELVCNNKKCWKVVKPLLSNKIVSSEKITLVEGTKYLINDKKTAKVLNNLFSTIIQNLKIPQYKEQDLISASISDPVMRTIVKYRVHPSIIAIKKNGNSSARFNFSFVDKEDILKEIKNLKVNKPTQNTDIPTKLIKENLDIFAVLIFENLNDIISQSVFPSALNLANITPVHKKIQKVKKIISGPSVSYQIFLKYMKGFSLNKFQNILNNFFPNINVDSEKVSVHNIACCQCLRNGNQLSITKKYLVLSSRIFPRHLTVSHMTF